MAIPIRANGGRVTAQWFNALRQAIIDLGGGGGIPETNFVAANNQVAAANITGLVFDSGLYRSAIVECAISRKTDTALSEVRAISTIYLLYRLETLTWDLQGPQEYGDFHGITFTVTGAGQVQYTSTNIAGANYVGTIKFRARTFNA
jgi:hypothetical protein